MGLVGGGLSGVVVPGVAFGFGGGSFGSAGVGLVRVGLGWVVVCWFWRCLRRGRASYSVVGAFGGPIVGAACARAGWRA